MIIKPRPTKINLGIWGLDGIMVGEGDSDGDGEITASEVASARTMGVIRVVGLGVVERVLLGVFVGEDTGGLGVGV